MSFFQGKRLIVARRTRSSRATASRSNLRSNYQHRTEIWWDRPEGLSLPRPSLAHIGPQPLLRPRSPVSAIEPQKDRRIGDRQIGFDDEHAKRLPGLIEIGNDFLMRQRVDRAPVEQLRQALPIRGDAGR